MTLSDTDRREFCPLHGWVGKAAFLRDRHDLCEAAEESPSLADEEVDAEPDVEPDVEPEVDPEVDPEIMSEPESDADEAEDANEDEEAAPRLSRSSDRRRRRGIPSKKTVAVRKITRLELQAGRAELRMLGADEPYDRPKTRGDCLSMPRPCLYVACSKNLYLDVSETGSIILNFPHREPWEMPADQSCSLDLAARGGMTLEEIATVTNLTRERIRQIEVRALIRRARPAARALGLSSEDAAAAGTRYHVGPGQDLAETGVDGELPNDIATILAGKR